MVMRIQHFCNCFGLVNKSNLPCKIVNLANCINKYWFKLSLQETLSQHKVIVIELNDDKRMQHVIESHGLCN